MWAIRSTTWWVGSDTFIFRTGFGNDVINDFAIADDLIDLTGTPLASLAEVLANTTQQGTDAVIDFGDDDSLTLVGVDRATLEANDFMLT